MAPADRPNDLSERLFIHLIGIGQICSWGSLLYSFPLIAEAMELELGWSKAELYGAASLGLACSGLVSYPIGRAVDLGLGRLVMSTGSALAAATLVVWAQTGELWAFYVCLAVLGVAQGAVFYEPAFAVIARRHGAARARSGITSVTLWGGFASTVFIPLVELLIQLYGWRGALLGLAGVNLTICTLIYTVAIDPKRDRDTSKDEPADGHRETPSTARDALGSPIFWLLSAAFLAQAAVVSALSYHGFPLLMERGMDRGAAVATLSLIGPAQVFGRLVLWRLSQSASIKRVGSITVVLDPLALAGFALLPPSFPMLAPPAVMHGAAKGIFTVVRGVAVPELLTRSAYGAINGLLAVPTMISKAAAPFAAALLWGAYGGYGGVLLVLILASSLSAVAFWCAAGKADARALKHP